MIHRTVWRFCTTALLIAAAIVMPLANAQNKADSFPNRSMKIVVPFATGSAADATSRVYGEMVSKLLGQPLLVENRPGGSGVLALQGVKAAPADGYTILMASNSPMAVNPIVIKNLPYDPFKDFRPVHGAFVGPVALVVRADSPHKTIKDLFAASKSANRPLTVGNYSAGYQLVGDWLGVAGGVPVNHVPYKGGAQMVTDLLGGQLDVGINDFSGVTQMISEGRLRALALTGAKRDARFPDIPTMKDSGYPDFETYVWASFFVHADTPDAIVAKLADAFQRVMTSDEGKAYQAKNAGEPLMLGPKEMGLFHLREFERFKRVADAAGIKPE